MAEDGRLSLGGGADSSNRPWETHSLQIRSGGSPLTYGLLAICAAAILSLADVALAHAAEGGYGFGLYQPLEALPRWRLMFGHGAGLLLLPVYIAGYWSVFQILRDAGVRRSWPVFALGSLTAIITAACHGEIALRDLLAGAGFGATASDRLLGLARDISDPLSGWINLPLALASLGFAFAVLSAHPRLPRWLAWANPMVLALAFVSPSLAAPDFAPALITAAASYNLGHLAFFCLVTSALRKHDPQ